MEENNDDPGALKEFIMKQDILGKLPTKESEFFRSTNVEILCMDTTNSHLVFGTNIGSSFLYNRETNHVAKLLSQKQTDMISCVKLHVGIECQVAMGTMDGKLKIIAFSHLVTPQVTKQVTKFELNQMHNNEVSCLHWSVNGMQLFSGDKEGSIYQTSINLEKNTCAERHVASCQHEIVQMEYRHKLLLVSTTESTMIINTAENNNIISIGSKSVRRGNFGACFSSNSITLDDLHIFATRPNLRLWKATSKGEVSSTLQLKRLVESEHYKIKMVSECAANNSSLSSNLQFGKIYTFAENLLVTFNGNDLFVIDHITKSIVGSHHHDCDIITVAVTTDEIFILCKNRKLHRISNQDEKEKLVFTPESEGNMAERSLQNMKETLDEMKVNMQPLVGTIQSGISSLNTGASEMTNKLQFKAKLFQQKFSFFNKSKVNEADLDLSEIAPNIEEIKIFSQNDDPNNLNKEENVPQVENVENPASNSYEEKCDNNVNIDTDLDASLKPQTSHVANLCEVSYKQDFLHSQGNLQHQNKETDKLKSLKPDRFTKLEFELTKSSGNEIVHKTVRRKRSKTSSTSKQSPESHKRENQLFEPSIQTETSQLHASLRITEDVLNTRKPEDIETITEVETYENVGANNILPSLSNHPMNEEDFVDNTEEKNQEQIVEDLIDDKKYYEKDINVETEYIEEELKVSTQEVNDKVPSSKVNEVVVAVHKSTGNKICPEIVLSPTNITTEFKFDSHSMEESENYDAIADDNNNLGCSEKDNKSEHDTDHESDFIQESDHEYEQSLDATSPESLPLDIYAQAESSDENKSNETGQMFKENLLFSDSSSEDEIDKYKPNKSFDAYQDSSCIVSMQLSDTWSIQTTPHEIITMGGCADLIWYIDYWDRIFISEQNIKDSKAIWKQLAKKAKQFSLAPSGDFAAIVTRSGNLYTAMLPQNLSIYLQPLKFAWKKVATGIHNVTLGLNFTVVVTTYGKLKVNFGLSRSSTNIKDWKSITTEEKIGEVALVNCGVIWVRTYTGNVQASRKVITNGTISWKEVPPPISPYTPCTTFDHIDSDGVDIMFACDSVGCMWFRTGITNECPLGDHWWQINVSEYVYDDQNLLPFALPTMTSKMSNTIHRVNNSFLSKVKVRQFGITHQSIWLQSDKHQVHVAKRQVNGYFWDQVNLPGLTDNECWEHVSTSSVFVAEDGEWKNLIWLARSNNEIFRFQSEDYSVGHPVTLLPPLSEGASILKLSACRTTVWVLSTNGLLHIRSGISSTCLSGTTWTEVDVSDQLRSVRFVDVCCSNQNVWGLSNSGEVYFRSGVEARNEHGLSPAWIKIDGCPTDKSHFVKIECAPSDMYVCALDNFGCAYARRGVSMEMPIGSKWEIMPGANGSELCVSNHTVTVLRTSGNLLQRYGISQQNCAGDYWKKIKTRFFKLAATPSNELWAIDREHRLRLRKRKVYFPNLLKALHDFGEEVASPDTEWEIL